MFYSLRHIVRSRAMSKAVTSKIYKPVAVYGSETEAVSGMDMNRLAAWVRRILRTICGLVVEEGI